MYVTELPTKVKKMDVDQAYDAELLLLMSALMRTPIVGRMKVWFIHVNTR